MRTICIYFVSALLILFAGCDDNIVGTGGGGAGEITLVIPGHPPEITSLRSTLSRDSTETIRTTTPLPVPSQAVVVTIANVPAGTWRLRLEGVAPNGVILYTGQTDVTVPADSSTTTAIHFNQVSGTIEFGPVNGPGSCVEPPGGIVGWWPGEDSPRDVADGNDGATGWPGVSYTMGRVGRAFRFDGVSGQIRVPDNPNLRITGSLTIEAWILAEGYPSDRASGQILFRGDDRIGIDPYFLTMLPDGRLLFHVASLSEAANLSTAAPLGTGTWHHVAAVLNAGTGAMAIYLDGAPAVSTTTTVRPFADLDPSYAPGLGIGNTQSHDLSHDQPFYGAIDELSVYAAALTAGQVSAIFEAAGAGKCGPDRPPPPDSITITTFARGFNRPAGLVFSAGGNLLVANFWDPGIISSVTPDGVVDTFAWGGGRAVAALARDAAGYIYGTFQDGTVKRAAPGGGPLSTFISGIANPAGIAVHPNGSIWVVDAEYATVNVYSASGSPQRTIPLGFVEPVGIAIHPSGAVYVAERSDDRIVRIDSSGAVVPFVSGIPSPHDMAFDAGGRLWVTGGPLVAGNNVYIISQARDVSVLPHEFVFPVGITFGPGGNLFVSNYGNGTVSKVVFPH